MPGSTNDRPLSGLRVLELGRWLPGPLMGRHLADLGAEVIKIEPLPHGDPARDLGPPAGNGLAGSRFFQLANRGKRSLALNLRAGGAADTVARIAGRCDLAIEGFRPGVAAALRVDYRTLARANPALVYVAISGYGQQGPWCDRAGHDINYLAMSGVLARCAAADGTPAVPEMLVGDLLGGALTGLSGALAALWQAQRTGRGRYVDVSMTESLLSHHLMGALADAPPGQGLLSGGMPCYGVYATADGRYLAVGALEPKFWEGLCQALGLTDWSAVGQSQGEAGAAAREALAAVLRGKTLAYWDDFFRGLDVCVTPVLDPEEVRQHPLHMARRAVAMAELPQPVAPWRDEAGAPLPPAGSAPALGQDTLQILAASGFAEAEIAALARDGVITG